MAFTLEQNVQGAAAYQQAIQPTSSTGLALAGNFLEGLDTFARSQVRQDQAEAQAANAARGTQVDRDRQEFGDLLNSARQDINAGQDPDAVAAAYAPRFAVLGLNPEERAIAENTLGPEIFAVPVQPANVADMGTTLFNDQPESVQLGLVALELQRAEQNGENIDTETATLRAVGTLMTTTAQAQASLQAGNLNWGQGYEGNMQTLDRLGEAVSSALSVETAGGNFNLQDLARLRAGYDMLRTQRAFMQPSGTLNAELWGQMNSKLESLDRLFLAIEDYDAKDATARATALMANIAMGVSEDNPLAILAMNSPQMIERLAAELTDDFATELATNGTLLDNVVSYRDLDFDPSIIQMMGFDNDASDTPTVLQTPETVFPSNLVEAHAETVADPATLTQAVDQLRQLTEGMSSAPDQVLATPEAREAWTSSVANMAYLLSEAPNPSTRNLDSLFSNQNLTVLRRMESEGGDVAEQATMLRQQMAQALRTSSNKYAITALGQIQQLPAVSINPETLTIELNNDQEYQGIQAVADLYYDGDFTRLWREGPSAWTSLRNRLARSGAITPDSPEYERFLASTKAINPSDPESVIWRGLANRYSQFSGVTDRLQRFRQYEENLNLDTGLQAILDAAVDRDAVNAAVGEALGEPPVATSVTTPPVTTTVLPPAGTAAPTEAAPVEATPTEAPLASMGVQGSGTEQDPITFTTETGMTAEMYQAVPTGAYYRDPTGLVSQKREGSRVTNNDRGDGDPLGSGTIVERTDRLGTVTGNGSRTSPIQPFWDTMSEQEAFDRIPNNVFFVDPDGVTRFKGE
jgi:hypothetical protein